MERFVFWAAITIAVIFGIGAMVGGSRFASGDGWGIHIDADGGTDPVLETTAGNLAPQTLEGTELRLKHLAALVTITPEDRQDYVVEITSPGGTPMPVVSSDDGRVTIDGRLRGRISRCTNDGGAELRGYGTVSQESMPRINIRAPRTLNISRSGAGTTQIGASEALELDFSGCSEATVADVVQALDVDFAGSGRVTAGAARRLNADVAGSGHLQVGAMAEGAKVDVAGSGEVTIASVTGEFTSDGAGSGNVSVNGGAVTDANVDLAGSGDVTIAAPVQHLTVSIVGSGDVDVQGTVGEIDADIAGSGGVRARAVTGEIRKEIWGSGDVRVGE